MGELFRLITLSGSPGFRDNHAGSEPELSYVGVLSRKHRCSVDIPGGSSQSIALKKSSAVQCNGCPGDEMHH
jgi:hypothetical protein